MRTQSNRRYLAVHQSLNLFASGGKKFNLVPMISLLAERKPMWYGDAFDVIPSNEARAATSVVP